MFCLAACVKTASKMKEIWFLLLIGMFSLENNKSRRMVLRKHVLELVNYRCYYRQSIKIAEPSKL